MPAAAASAAGGAETVIVLALGTDGVELSGGLLAFDPEAGVATGKGGAESGVVVEAITAGATGLFAAGAAGIGP